MGFEAGMKRRTITVKILIKAMWVLMLSAYYRWLMLYKPFAAIEKGLGQKDCETSREPVDAAITDEVGWLVPAVCTRTPWQSMCLVQALCARKLLNHKHLPCTIYFGVARGENEQLTAHAWLRCGNRVVTGGEVAKQFTVTGIYGDVEKVRNS